MADLRNQEGEASFIDSYLQPNDAFALPDAFKDERAFLQNFWLFCNDRIPPNQHLRARMVFCIQSSSLAASSLQPFSWYDRQATLPKLAEVWDSHAERVLQQSKITYINIENCGEHSLKRLRADQMINDEVVDTYLNLIRKRGAIIGTSLLLNSKMNSQHPIDRNITTKHLSQHRQVFIPICQNEHWTFVLIRQRGNLWVIKHFDSLQPGSRPPSKFLSWISNQELDGISCKYEAGLSPVQRNGLDCGLFMLMGIRLMSCGSQHLSQEEADELIPHTRRRVLAEILAGSLDPMPDEYESYRRADTAEAARPIRSPSEPVRVRGTGNAEEPMEIDFSETSESALTPASILNEESTDDQSSEGLDSVPEKVQSISPMPLEEHISAQAGLIQTIESIPIPDSTFSPQVIALPSPNSANSVLGTAHKSPRKSSAIAYAKSFAEERHMINILKASVNSYRMRAPAKSPYKRDVSALAALWARIGADTNPQNLLQTRYEHALFSHTFYQEAAKIDGEKAWKRDAKQKLSPGARSHLKYLLKCSDTKGWVAAQRQARRGQIWNELMDMFRPFIPDPYIVLCACPEKIHTMEMMSTRRPADKKIFLDALQRRICDPEDLILARL